MSVIINQIIRLFGQDKRSRNLSKNSLIMFVCKGMTMLIGFFLLPLTIGFVDSETYGIWVTISSMAAWMSVFDIGMGNGLKNRFVESRTKGDNAMAQKYVSTTYAMLTFIFIPLLLLFLLLNTYLDWEKILNVHSAENLNLVFAIVISYFSLNFILTTINTILIADQRPGESSIRMVIQQLLVLLAIVVMTKTMSGSLLKLCIALCLIPLLVIFLFNITLFSNRYKNIRPLWSCVQFSLVKDLLSLSLKFFYLQVVALILFQLVNFIIIRYYTANDVTLYNVAHRYFFIPNGFFAAVSTPIWAAVTEALTLNDYSWIQKAIKKYSCILLLFFLVELFMLIIATPVYHLWMGNTITEIPFLISLLCMSSACVTMSTHIFVSALCGSNYLRLQMFFCLFSPFVFVFLCYLFIKVLDLGVWCILLANILANIYGVLIAPLQCYLVFFRRKKGIWTA